MIEIFLNFGRLVTSEENRDGGHVVHPRHATTEANNGLASAYRAMM